MRALNLLRESTGCDCGASVVLHKRIPSAAGMGGGSSDAAAALVAGNRLWRLNQRRETLCEMAASLGSDVPFFLGASPATCRGRGEKIVPARNLGRLEFVIVRPPVGLSTAKVYAACTPRRPETMSSFESAVAPVPCAGQVARWMRNGLQAAAELLTPWIGRLRGVFDRLGVHSHQLTGSGSAYFGICRSAGQSVKIAKQLRAMGLGRVLRASSARGLL